MEERQMFRALVRCLGLYFFTRAIVSAGYAAAHVVPIPVTAHLPFAEDLTFAILNLVFAAVAFGGTDFLADLAYGRDAKLAGSEKCH